jgi:hypothetical protein
MCWHISLFSCTQPTFVAVTMWNLYTNVGSRYYCMLRVVERDMASWALKYEVFVVLCLIMTWMRFVHHREVFIEKQMRFLAFVFSLLFLCEMHVCLSLNECLYARSGMITGPRKSNFCFTGPWVQNQWLKWIGPTARRHEASCATSQCNYHKKKTWILVVVPYQSGTKSGYLKYDTRWKGTQPYLSLALLFWTLSIFPVL